jgi:hypothetical protein
MFMGSPPVTPFALRLLRINQSTAYFEKIESLRGYAAPLSSLARVPVVLNNYPESWPGLSRPSTPFRLKISKKDVDARDKRGHDAEEVIRSHRNAL